MSEQRQPYFGLSVPESRGAPASVWDRPRVPEPRPRARRWQINALLFVVTMFSTFLQGALYNGAEPWDEETIGPASELFQWLLSGWTFALPLLAILLFHEFGHYIAARLHKVDASLPYFIPLPIVSPFGTMGAVIAMRGRIKSRNALLDIGAAGPLAGLVVAIPVLFIGLSQSSVGPVSGGHYMQEGQSLIYMAMKRIVLGPIPPGYDAQIHPTAFAGWSGLFVTMLNLLPWGQLDGGHVAYALFGPRQDGYARWVRAALLPLFLYNLVTFVTPVLRGHSSLTVGAAVMNSLFWLIWFVATGIIARVSGSSEHPPTEPGELSPVRRVVAVVTLALFFLLFMPTPLAQY